MQRDLVSTGTPLRILVADDNRDAADSLGFLLQLWGYVACVTYGGHEALQSAAEFLPHVLLLDIGMPQLDGFSVTRAVRKLPALQGVTIVAITAYSDSDTRHRAAEAGFDLLLVKPVDPVTLHQVLERIKPPQS